MSDAWKTVGTRVVPVHIDGSPKDFPYVVTETPSPLDEEVEKASKLAAQWPKPHACRPGPSFICKEVWDSWPTYHAGEDEFASYEMKHCPYCSSTLMALTKIHDLEAK